MDTILLLSRIEVILSAGFAVGSVIMYAVYSPKWKETPFGRVLFSVIAVFALTTLVSALTIVYGIEHSWVVILRATVYFLLTLAWGTFFISIVIIQERGYLEGKRSNAKHRNLDSEGQEP